MNKLKIGNIELNNDLLLAPIAGFSDIGMRTLCKMAGAGLTCTEMVSAKALCYDNQKTKDLLLTESIESPCMVQLFGYEPECFEKALQKSELAKFDIININMGCPASKVIKNNEGSALMKNMEQAKLIIEACKRVTSKPVTVKFRSGWDEKNKNAVEFAKMCESAGADAIIVHGRTSKQGYSGKADMEIIRQVKNAVKIPVIANGDCVTKEDYIRMKRESGADGVMIARGAIGNPKLFSEITGQEFNMTILEQITTHIDILRKYFSDRLVALVMRSHIPFYLKGLKNSVAVKIAINKSENIDETLKILKNFFLES